MKESYKKINEQPTTNIKEINGRWTCTDCGYEWSAMLGDNEIPTKCDGGIW